MIRIVCWVGQAGWWLDSCTQHQDNDKLWTSGGHQCKYGGAKTGPMVITPAIFSLLFSPHILMKMMKEDKDALCDSTWTRSRNYELVSVYLDLSGVWINLRYPLQWQRAHAMILMGEHVSTQHSVHTSSCPTPVSASPPDTW